MLHGTGGGHALPPGETAAGAGTRHTTASHASTSAGHPGKASIARLYDYWLGGQDNFPVDRQPAAKLLAINPDAVSLARENRAFLRRGVQHVGAEGIRQYLDIGSGIPTAPNVHEIARAQVPEARVVYIDRDPVVVDHCRRRLGARLGGLAVIDGDMREPGAILADPAFLRLIDFCDLMWECAGDEGISASDIASKIAGVIISDIRDGSVVRGQRRVLAGCGNGGQ